ncbi:8-amino-7-oxononanoate synthase [Mesorhizobium sp.]|uniref:8-amino-7-oxononanoate synthase n=1 Tax=Mesorhizobium sp. TaxID=1871066 RepID=UPI000FE644A4|nr:8-amino-7-oxononanoate synthase [Mesorhizobium sp.]RWI16767.1 MAG: 8-amino-7-oxononanoate synthase [Mesorhizobium sp.]RWN08742.1 MAG: 8-amino-7-oxononanoate synthase [Mesorhizobium sp.]RWN16168.1 MAG: 8-amino-7-oxononanoate synthase [Mesorhizobium sp.]TIQ97530.1 MAG: 8-amino-7-oxononanoate synthase [Mesorhizobium sp.]
MNEGANGRALLDRYRASLRGLARKDRLRGLSGRSGADFASNDYLGLARSKRMADAVAAALDLGTPVGATGSRLLRGNDPEHEALEAKAAAFFGAERALFFGGGYVANFAVLTTLPQKGDLIVLDELIHASAREGARAGRAEVSLVGHNDADAVDDAITTWRAKGGVGRPWIVAESLYSMDGDRAPLGELMEIADRHDAFLFVDEAHATGVYGPDGRGLAHDLEGRENVVVLHTCGKALGASGALITAPGVLCDFLVNRCRPFIYATAPSPLMAVAAATALEIVADEPERRARLARLLAIAGKRTEQLGLPVSGSQIMPVIVGDNARAMALAEALQARSFDVRGIRPPTVPEGKARLRISLTLNVGEDDVSALFDALAEEWESTQ